MVSQIKSTSGTVHEIVDRSAYETVVMTATLDLNDYTEVGKYSFTYVSQVSPTKYVLHSPEDPNDDFVVIVSHYMWTNHYCLEQAFAYAEAPDDIIWTRYAYKSSSSDPWTWNAWDGVKRVGWDIRNYGQKWSNLDRSLNETLTKKKNLNPSVVSVSSIDLNSYTSSGTYILTGSITTKTNFPVLTPGQLEVTRWMESSSNYFCRQEFKVYDKAYRFQNDSFTRMGTSSNGTTWDWGPWGSDQYFIAGETFTLGSGYGMYGHITSSTTRIYIYTVLPKSLRYVNVTKPTSTISIDVRQNGKYVQANPYSFTVDSLSKFGDAQQPCGIEIGLKNANGTALTNGTNNDTVSAQLRANLTLSFTARTL